MSTTRRNFLAAGGVLGAAWILKDLVVAEDALAWARHAVQQKPPPAFSALTPEEAAVIEAAAARIIPADDLPGAKEAGVVYFIDRAFSTFQKQDLPDLRKFIADLNRRARRRKSDAADFAALPPADQDAILRQIENTPEFGGLRFMTIVGMFANPSWGGNKDMAGWKMLGFMPHGAFQPPFGHYDAEAAKGR